MSDEIKDSCTHGEESWYCVICRDDYVEGLQAQVAQLQTTISTLTRERDVLKYLEQDCIDKMGEIDQLQTTISQLQNDVAHIEMDRDIARQQRDDAIAAARVMSGKIDAYCADDELLQATISQLREHVANLLGLSQVPLENITDYTVFGDAANIPKGDKNDAG